MPETEPADRAIPDRVVAIDGPSGAGKSTVARALARRLGFAYLDTGAMYRAATLWFLRHGWFASSGDVADPGSPRARLTAELLDRLVLELPPGEPQQVLLNGEDVAGELRSQQIEALVSDVASVPAVRTRMRGLQRELARRGPLVAEGRDMTSVVFPSARWQFYLDAANDERARRRLRDFLGRGIETDVDRVRADIDARDRLDTTRADAPLRRVDRARFIDTTGLTIVEVVEQMARQVEADLGCQEQRAR